MVSLLTFALLCHAMTLLSIGPVILVTYIMCNCNGLVYFVKFSSFFY